MLDLLSVMGRAPLGKVDDRPGLTCQWQMICMVDMCFTLFCGCSSIYKDLTDKSGLIILLSYFIPYIGGDLFVP